MTSSILDCLLFIMNYIIVNSVRVCQPVCQCLEILHLKYGCIQYCYKFNKFNTINKSFYPHITTLPGDQLPNSSCQYIFYKWHDYPSVFEVKLIHVLYLGANCSNYFCHLAGLFYPVVGLFCIRYLGEYFPCWQLRNCWRTESCQIPEPRLRHFSRKITPLTDQ